MRDYARFSPTFWTGDTGRKIRGQPDVQIVLAYLITCPNSNMIGLYYLPLPIVGHETGLPSGEVSMAFKKLRDHGVAFYDHEQEIVYVPTMAAWQIGESIPASNKNLIKGVNRELERFEKHEFGQDFIARYDVAFCLGRGFEGAPKVLGTGDSTPDRPLRDQDQAQEQEHDQEQATAARAPARSNGKAKIWAAWDWREAFGRAWTDKYGGLRYGGAGDSTAIPRLSEVLDRLTDEERFEAQGIAAAMFAEFLANPDPKYVDKRHPFAFFVQDWGGLRAPKQQVAPHETFDERDRRLASERADKERRRHEEQAKATSAKVREILSTPALSPTEKQDIHALVHGLAESKAVAS